MHARVVLGVGNVSCLERCPQFRSIAVKSLSLSLSQEMESGTV